MSVPEKNIALLCNPTKKKAVRLGDAIAVQLRKKGVSFSLFTAYWPAVWAHFTEAWVVGGDGTVNFFINQYPNFQLPIAVFPGGSGNDLHRTLYQRTTITEQIECVLNATPKLVDAGLCNGRLFLNGIGIGFDGAVVERMVRAGQYGGGRAYVPTILKTLFTYNEQTYTLTLNSETRTQRCFMISIANGRSFGGGFNVAPRAVPTDGLLDVMCVRDVNVLTRLRYLPVIQKGAHLHLPFVSYQQTDRIVIKCAATVAAHCDGEPFCATTFDIRCLLKRFSLLW